MRTRRHTHTFPRSGTVPCALLSFLSEDKTTLRATVEEDNQEQHERNTGPCRGQQTTNKGGPAFVPDLTFTLPCSKRIIIIVALASSQASITCSGFVQTPDASALRPLPHSLHCVRAACLL